MKKRITPKHREDIEKRKDRDIDFLILGIALMAGLGLIGHCLGSFY